MPVDAKKLDEAASRLARTSRAMALTGAGISVESGIPDFRGSGGLWARFDPMEYAVIDAFHADPAKIWRMLRELTDLVTGARPNAGHAALADLERMGHLGCIVTQNVDGLHQEAGNTKVVEFHGSGRTLVCLGCREVYPAEEFDLNDEESFPPTCKCGRILKPEVVFFGEAIPQEASETAFREAQGCEVMIVAGTSAVVAPASSIPVVAKRAGAFVIEVNLEPTALTGSITDIHLAGSTGEILPAIVERIGSSRN